MTLTTHPAECWPLPSGHLRFFFSTFWIALLLSATAVAGGDMSSLSQPMFSSDEPTHRQDVCNRYDLWRSGEIELRDALSGMSLHPLMARGDFFNYNHDTGMDEEDPGLMADLMDALAESANFTWRQSFGVMEAPEDLNRTWTEMLIWSIENYDIAVNWWDQSVERMELGAAYIEPWFDGSIILVDQEDPPEDVNTIRLLNWLRPFENSVWALTIATILVSALAYQYIEYLHDEREERSMAQWFSDNLYLSSLNFTQNFEYAPNSTAGRIFGVSMGVWALVMTATYTANLASLFVEQQRPALVVDSIDQAVLLQIPICTYGNTNADVIIQERYEDAIRVPKVSELEAYRALRRGECGLVAGYKDNWLGYQETKLYNPECDLEWVGRVVEVIKSGFAVKADAGHLCTSLIRDVFNLHLIELIGKGVLDAAWEKHRSKTKDQDCVADDTDITTTFTRRRRLNSKQKPPQTTKMLAPQNNRRRLKGGSSASAASGSSSGSGGQSSLTLNQMLGTFVLHWFVTAIAIAIALVSTYYQREDQKQVQNDNEDPQKQQQAGGDTYKMTYRRHGPIIGNPPRTNTFVVRNYAGRPLETLNEQHPNNNTSLYNWPRLQGRQPSSGGMDNNDKQRDEQAPEQAPCEWQRSHADLQQKQQHLSTQMDSVLALLHEMRQEQRQLQERSSGSADQGGSNNEQ